MDCSLYSETFGRTGKIALDKQRYLINNFNLAQELGAKVVRMKESSVHQGILEYVNQHNITTVCIGKPRPKLWQRISGYSWIYTLMNRLNENILILLFYPKRYET